MRTHNETLVKAILKAYSEGRESFNGFALNEQTTGTETQKQTYRVLQARRISEWIEEGHYMEEISKKRALELMGDETIYVKDGGYYLYLNHGFK
tara:strand:+ start:416 stop:697 length:282 start_codon:yes stop_codon:yes gene_type:complete